MFVRTVTKPNGKQYHYVLKSVLDKKRGHSVHRVISDLSALPAQVVNIVKAMLKGQRVRVSAAAREVLTVRSTRYFAPLWIAFHFWAGMNLHLMKGFTRKEYRRLTALVLARVVEPAACRSELRTAEWLRKSALHLILGGGPEQWDRDNFYPLLAKLSDHWLEIETHLWEQRRSVPRLYLYDITSTYFEGKGGSFGALGYSRDERPANPQLVIALVADEAGLPLAMRILPGNTKDSTTVSAAIAQLKNQFGVTRAVLIMDRGMVTEANLETLARSGLDHILALPHKQAREFLSTHNHQLQWELFDQRSLAEWTEGGKRHILCRNPQAAARDRQTRERILTRAENRLSRLAKMVRDGRIKSRDKILARTVKILTQTKTEKYFLYEVDTAQLRYWRSDLAGLQELYEGCYVLATSLPAEEVGKKEIDTAYRNQREIEEVFKSCKDELYLRPNFHRKDKNIFGHIRLTFLAHLVKKTLELKLRQAHCLERGSSFLEHFADVAISEAEINGERQDVITELTEAQRELAGFAGVNIPAGALNGSLRSLLPEPYQAIIA